MGKIAVPPVGVEGRPPVSGQRHAAIVATISVRPCQKTVTQGSASFGPGENDRTVGNATSSTVILVRCDVIKSQTGLSRSAAAGCAPDLDAPCAMRCLGGHAIGFACGRRDCVHPEDWTDFQPCQSSNVEFCPVVPPEDHPLAVQKIGSLCRIRWQGLSAKVCGVRLRHNSTSQWLYQLRFFDRLVASQ